MENMVSVEKIKLKDIFAIIRDMFSTLDNIEDDKRVNEKLKKVYEIQDEIGATKRIILAEKFVDKFAEKESKKKDITSVRSDDAKVNAAKREYNNQILDIQEKIEDDGREQ